MMSPKRCVLFGVAFFSLLFLAVLTVYSQQQNQAFLRRLASEEESQRIRTQLKAAQVELLRAIETDAPHVNAIRQKVKRLRLLADASGQPKDAADQGDVSNEQLESLVSELENRIQALERKVARLQQLHEDRIIPLN